MSSDKENNTDTIEITHIFSYINIFQVSRKLYEDRANSPSNETSSEGLGKC